MALPFFASIYCGVILVVKMRAYCLYPDNAVKAKDRVAKEGES